MFDIDPGTLMQALGAWKNATDALKQSIELVRTMGGATGGSTEQKKVLEQTLATATSSAAFAEAELARAFGYELCKCTIPPIPMLTVGYSGGNPVYECPKCGFNTATAARFGYTRTAPPKS
jgi:hypothetical protein